MKKTVLGFGMAVLCLMLFACGKTETQLNVTETAKALVEQGVFEDTMSETQSNIFEMLYYGVDSSTVEELAFYMSTGATAEEVMVARCVTEEAAETLEAIAKERVTYLKSSFENYVPKELTKLENPVLQREGRYVILCISADDQTAKNILKQQSGK